MCGGGVGVEVGGRPCATQREDLSLLIRDQIHALCSGSMEC